MASLRVPNLRVSIILLLSTIGTCTSELKLLQSIFRHGDRYPLSFSATKLFNPLNPYANVSWYPNSDGGLTINGKRRSYDLGKVLRERYGDWFGQRYSRRNVVFISPDNERTKMTASLVAAGLFAPYNGSQMWNPSLNWQPVPISFVRYPEIILFHGALLCSKHIELLETTRNNDPTIIEYDKQMKNLYEFVSRNIGVTVDNRILYYMHMELLAAVSGGLTPPKWSEGIFPHGSLEDATIAEYKYSSWTDELKRITGGIWLKKWLDHVDDYISESVKSEEKKKAFFYSGHDVNVAGIINTLGIFYYQVPNYSSAINLELHEDEKKRFYVKVAHRNSGEFIDYVIPGCNDILCPLDTFKNIFSNVLTVNATEECGSFGLYNLKLI